MNWNPEAGPDDVSQGDDMPMLVSAMWGHMINLLWWIGL